VTSVKDQLDCSSSWAFAAVAAMESMYLIDNPEKATSCIDLSEQALIDCDPEYGCDGGWPYDVLRAPKGFAVKKGITYERLNPYQAYVHDYCVNPKPKIYNKNLVPNDECNDGNEHKLKKMLQKGPVVVGFATTSSFRNYESGIYDDDSCSGDDVNRFSEFVT
jgi:C1A family cysteine protease